MTFDEDIDSLRQRVARAQSECDAWRAAGRQEKYLEAYFMVDDLELQLDARLRRHAPATAPC